MASLGWLKDKLVVEDNLAKSRALAAVAADLGISQAALSLAWCLRNPGVSTVITGASKVAHLEENLRALDAVALLDDAVLARIEEILDNKPTSGLF
jgi:aryl-alcohol dehydrogenase-like predicted oxidoreductase